MIYRVRGDPVGDQRGEGAVLARRRSLVLLLVLLSVAAPAQGTSTPTPWSGGPQRVAPFEAAASRIATSLAGRGVSIHCVDEATWRSLAEQHGFDPGNTWALTPLHRESSSGTVVADGYSNLSPRACRLADSFFSKPAENGTRTCRHGTKTQWASRPGNRHRKPTRKVQVRVPVYGECDDWAAKLVAVHVLGHESMHLAGVVDEAQADCLTAQVDAFVAAALGADPRFARSLAREYWAYYYPSQDRGYRSPDCHDDGTLDIVPERKGWPTPPAYPSDLVSRIGVFAAASSPTTAFGRVTRTRAPGKGSLVRVVGAYRHTIR